MKIKIEYSNTPTNHRHFTCFLEIFSKFNYSKDVVQNFQFPILKCHFFRVVLKPQTFLISQENFWHAATSTPCVSQLYHHLVTHSRIITSCLAENCIKNQIGLYFFLQLYWMTWQLKFDVCSIKSNKKEDSK